MWAVLEARGEGVGRRLLEHHLPHQQGEQRKVGASLDVQAVPAALIQVRVKHELLDRRKEQVRSAWASSKASIDLAQEERSHHAVEPNTQRVEGERKGDESELR